MSSRSLGLDRSRDLVVVAVGEAAAEEDGDGNLAFAGAEGGVAAETGGRSDGSLSCAEARKLRLRGPELEAGMDDCRDRKPSLPHSWYVVAVVVAEIRRDTAEDADEIVAEEDDEPATRRRGIQSQSGSSSAATPSSAQGSRKERVEEEG